ncbi:S9 family peptidase [Microbacterium sp. NPDC055903]
MSQPFGSWESPFTASDIAVSAPRIDGGRFVGDDIWWGESVPSDGGRVTVRSSSGDEILPAPWSARSRVHEYGGGAWTADASGILYFVDGMDQRVYRLVPGGDPEPLTSPGPQHGGLRLQYGRLFAVRENLVTQPHRRAIVEIDTTGSGTSVVHAEGSGFFAHPALSPDGTRLAWVQWDEHRMPWESAQIAIRRTNGGDAQVLATRAALQPEWLSKDELVYADDPGGRWNLHRQRLADITPTGSPEPISPADADTGYGLWVLGNRWFRPLADGTIIAVRTNGSDEIVSISADGTATPLQVPADGHASVEDAVGTRILVTGGGSRTTAGLWLIDSADGTARAIAGGHPVAAEWMPPAMRLVVDGERGPVHAFAYPPSHPEQSGPSDALPPYIVFVHGGPTAHVAGSASASIAYYTSRGIGVLDVNYGGSTGYGRAYRERLNGAWGIVDVEDVLTAARGLADAGLADPARIAIRGGSAGGWTVLSALVRGGVFAAGISRYGVSDLRALVEDTHDFERYYLDGLVGPLPAAEDVYIERSPLTHAGRIDVPVLLLQGADDKVVPPSQSQAIADALAARGVDHEYVVYEGEGHGFRTAATIIDALERELAFLGRVFGFEPAL